MSASYTGEVAKTNCEVVTYTAIFGSTKLEEPEQTPTPEPAPNAELAANGDGSGMGWLSLLGCAGGVAALAVAAVYGVKKIKERSVQK